MGAVVLLRVHRGSTSIASAVVDGDMFHIFRKASERNAQQEIALAAEVTSAVYSLTIWRDDENIAQELLHM